MNTTQITSSETAQGIIDMGDTQIMTKHFLTMIGKNSLTSLSERARQGRFWSCYGPRRDLLLLHA